MSPQCTADAELVESVAKLINNENDEFVAAHSLAHDNEMALKSRSFSLLWSFAVPLRCRVMFSIPPPPPMFLAELLLGGLPGLLASTSLTCQVSVAHLTFRLCFPSDNQILCVV